MSERFSSALLVTLAALLLTASSVFAHGAGAAIEVEPETITAGGTVTVVGENLEPNDERILVLVGADVRLDLGTVTTDAAGMFSQEVTIPAHLPGAVYEFQAIGDETLTVQLNVLAASGMAQPSAAPAVSEPLVRNRSGLDYAGLLIVAALALVSGLLLVLNAERLGGHLRV